MNKTLIILGAPTAVGKTELSIKLAKKFKSEIISSDSRQFYKELNAGVAKPSELQLKELKHHFISHKSIKKKYSVREYELDTLELLTRLFKKHDLLFLTGGSGLYIDAVAEGLNNFPEIETKIRKKINTDFKEKGLLFLSNELKSVDIVTYKKIDTKNPRRVMRALEIYRSAGKPYSFYTKKEKEKRNFKSLFITIDNTRKKLYKRINDRVDQMINDGLLDEARKLYKYQHSQALQTIGYQELFKYFEKKNSLNDAINEIKKNTRRYAKRQINWFNHKKYHRFNINQEMEIIKLIQNQFK